MDENCLLQLISFILWVISNILTRAFLKFKYVFYFKFRCKSQVSPYLYLLTIWVLRRRRQIGSVYKFMASLD